ncbi:MAG: FemAB family PEP-CTERM system-associated protein [Planctomycetes bacterium]|nr:FemAB family PEP-CTERM system-associated protein [Planctomycetota bacterium]
MSAEQSPSPAEGKLLVRASAAADDAARDRFVRTQPRGTFFHLAGWRRAVERAFGHEPLDLVAWRADELVGVLPLMRCERPLSGSHLVSMPYAVYGGPVASDAQAARALVEHAEQLARRERVGRMELRCAEDPDLGAPFQPSSLYAAFVHPLPPTVPEVMARMPKRARAEVRKAADKHGLTLSEGRWYLGDLERLFLSSKQSLGSPGLPRRWFEALAEEFGRDVLVHCVHKQERVLAATMSFVFRDTLLFYYIGTTPDANREYSATNFLSTRLQELGVERGLAWFDLGRSRVDSGPYQFKQHQGFEPRALPYRYLLVKSRALPSFNPSNPRTEKLRRMWAGLPPWMARSLSGSLMRYLP